MDAYSDFRMELFICGMSLVGMWFRNCRDTMALCTVRNGMQSSLSFAVAVTIRQSRHGGKFKGILYLGSDQMDRFDETKPIHDSEE
jgi:hypothetical protein